MTRSGGCNCGSVRYEILNEPLFTHVCHCKQCQRSSGGAFNVSTVLLIQDLKFEDCTPDIHFVSGPTGNEYEVWGCDQCGCTIGGRSVSPAKEMVLRPGTLDDITGIKPQAHIWIKEKQDWVNLPTDLPLFNESYDAEEIWPENSLKRLEGASLIND